MKFNLSILEGQFTIHRLAPGDEIPMSIFQSPFFSISKTDNELSAVCPSTVAVDSGKSDSGWSCIKVLGPLDLSLTGVLAEISAVLAEAEISIFAISTFDTDYILVKSDNLHAAKEALQSAEYTFNVNEQPL